MKTVRFVHCVDTEGPLNETLASTFKRLYDAYGVRIKPTMNNLRKIQNCQYPFKNLSKKLILSISKTFSPALLNYNSNWMQLNKMLKEVTSDNFRNKFKDSFGKGWLFNWFIMDHVGFNKNPRKRSLGYNKIWDSYIKFYAKNKILNKDGFHFHHHPPHFSFDANKCATHYFSVKPTIYDVLNRKIIDRNWFPSVFRPGFHTVRPDINWFVEQFIPFEYSNQSVVNKENNYQKDITSGRFGDWRRSPTSWTPYQPDLNDYQSRGKCSHLKARCLNVGTRLRLINLQDIEQAFNECSNGKNVVVSFANHDYRDMKNDIYYIYDLILKAKKKFKNINFSWSEAREAMQKITKNICKDISYKQTIKKNTLIIEASNPIFGPQPYFAIKTKNKNYFHDNLDIQEPFKKWSYSFDENSINLNDVEKIGWAANDKIGRTTVCTINPKNKNFFIKKI